MIVRQNKAVDFQKLIIAATPETARLYFDYKRFKAIFRTFEITSNNFLKRAASFLGCFFLLLALDMPLYAAPVKDNDTLLKAARSGNPQAQLQLAHEYFFAKNRVGNPALALYWYRQSANQGIGEAQYNLGCCFLHGWGVSPHPIVALQWFKLAANKGVHAAKLEYLKLLYQGVEGENCEYGNFAALPSNPEKAISQMRELSKIFPQAKLELVKILRSQADTQRECITLLHSYTRQFPHHPEAAVSYGEILLATGQLALATQEFERAAKFKHPQAYAVLAEILEGRGLKDDLNRSLQLTTMAANANNPLGLVQLGKHQLLGVRIPHDPMEAFKNFQKAAQQDFPLAWRYLGECFCYGIGTQQDFKKAANAWSHGATAGNAESAYQLGMLHLQGKGVIADPVVANHYFRQAARKKHPAALRELGLSLVEGRGCQQNYAAGAQLLKQAASLEN